MSNALSLQPSTCASAKCPVNIASVSGRCRPQDFQVLKYPAQKDSPLEHPRIGFGSRSRIIRVRAYPGADRISEFDCSPSIVLIWWTLTVEPVPRATHNQPTKLHRTLRLYRCRRRSILVVGRTNRKLGTESAMSKTFCAYQYCAAWDPWCRVNRWEWHWMHQEPTLRCLQSRNLNQALWLICLWSSWRNGRVSEVKWPEQPTAIFKPLQTYDSRRLLEIVDSKWYEMRAHTLVCKISMSLSENCIILTIESPRPICSIQFQYHVCWESPQYETSCCQSWCLRLRCTENTDQWFEAVAMMAVPKMLLLFWK